MKAIAKLNIFLLLLMSQTGFAINNDDGPMLPEIAFQSEVTVKDANTLIAKWTIADKTYLYRNKIKFANAGKVYQIGKYELPKGKVKKDPLFGKVNIFRQQVSVEIPIKRLDPNTKQISITTHWQGCADMGVCYPPQKKVHTVLLAAADTKNLKLGDAEKKLAIKKVADIGSNLGLNDNQDMPLPVGKAFKFSTSIEGKQYFVKWDITKDYYLYRNKVKITALTNGIKVKDVKIPKGKTKKDPLFGQVQVFYNSLNVSATLEGELSDKIEKLQVVYQGCAEAGICYPPVRKIVSINKTGIAGIQTLGGFGAPPTKSISSANFSSASSDVIISTDAKQACDTGQVSELGQLEKILSDGNLWLVIGVFLIAGLLLAFTPCVFPMIPILFSIIAGQGDKISTKKAFSLSLIYVLSMAVVYTSVGVLAGLMGKNLNAIFNDPIAIIAFVIVFLILALSMFGVFTFQMPGSVQNRLSNLSNNQKGGSVFGVIIMGVLAALIAGPCVAAPIAAALIFIGNQGDATLGGIALFSMSIGMGIPLLILGTGGGKYLPKAGAWMDRVKAFFGIGLLALAIYLLDRLEGRYMPEHVILIISGVLALFTAFYMGLFSAIKEGANNWAKVWKLVSVGVLTIGLVWIIAGATKGDSLLDPLGHLSKSSTEHHLKFKKIKSISDLAKEVNLAKSQGKSVMLDFYADWCIECVRMERTTFSDPTVQAALNNTVVLQADVTKDDAIDQLLRNKFNIPGPPAILFFNKKGEELRKYRFFGYMKAEPFAKLLQGTLCN